MAVVLWIIAALLTALVVHDVVSADSTCRSQIPLFEGLSVQEANAAWPPPLVRCTLVDHDMGQLGETAPADVWGWGDLAFVIVVDVLAMAEATRRFVRKRARRRQLMVNPEAKPSLA